MENNKSVTAVEWLKMQLEIRSGIKEITVDLKTFEELCERAKEIEREHILNICYFAYNEGCSYMIDGKKKYESFEQYYNATFKK